MIGSRGSASRVASQLVGEPGGEPAGLLLMYLLWAIAQIQPGLDWIATFSAFDDLCRVAIIDGATQPVGDIVLFALLALAAWALAAWPFERRDLVAQWRDQCQNFPYGCSPTSTRPAANRPRS